VIWKGGPVYSDIRPIIMSCFRRVGVPPSEWDDLYHEVIIAALEKDRFSIDKEGENLPYVVGIARNMAVSHQRRRGRVVVGTDNDAATDLENGAYMQDVQLGYKIDVAVFEKALNTLNKPDREIINAELEFRMFYHEGPSNYGLYVHLKEECGVFRIRIRRIKAWKRMIERVRGLGRDDIADGLQARLDGRTKK
jgi:hypothetical protein